MEESCAAGMPWHLRTVRRKASSNQMNLPLSFNGRYASPQSSPVPANLLGTAPWYRVGTATNPLPLESRTIVRAAADADGEERKGSEAGSSGQENRWEALSKQIGEGLATIHHVHEELTSSTGFSLHRLSPMLRSKGVEPMQVN